MKPSLILVLCLPLLAAGISGRGFAQDLPRTLLQLPPLPIPAAAPPAVSRPAGLPGGASPVYVPISHLTLPEKPAVTGPAAILSSEKTAAGGSDDLLAINASDPVPDDLLPLTENPLLPGLSPSASHSPDSVPDLLPTPDESTAPGFIEIHSGPETPPALLPPTPAAEPESTAVPSSDLSPGPDKSPETADPAARGPLFRIKGGDAYLHARSLGYRFTPAQGQGRRDGIHTVASQVPNVLTSEVHGPRMMQMRPSPLWTTASIENTFYMFCDANYNAVRLQPGWKIRGIQLKGPNWQWVACPKSGATTASFSVRLRAWKTVDTPAQGTVVTLQGLTLEGPPGATDWKAAFPTLVRSSALARSR